MKKITMFHIEDCRYCDFAKKAIEELRAENAAYNDVEIEMINENEHCLLVGNDREAFFIRKSNSGIVSIMLEINKRVMGRE